MIVDMDKQTNGVTLALRVVVARLKQPIGQMGCKSQIGRINTGLIVEVLVGTRGIQPRESRMPCTNIDPEEVDSIRDERWQTTPKLQMRWWKGVLPQAVETSRAGATIVRLLHVGEACDAMNRPEQCGYDAWRSAART